MGGLDNPLETMILGVTEILCSLRLVLEGKTDKEIPESSRLEFLEKFLAKQLNFSVRIYLITLLLLVSSGGE